MSTPEARMRADVETLCAAGTRRVGSDGHRQARVHLVARVTELGLAGEAGRGTPGASPFEQPYGDGPLCNVIARRPGRHADRPPLLLAAHHDTCGDQPGADDNAAAIAIALEVARGLAAGALERDLLLALFDAEEPPHFLTPTMGSTYWYRHQRTREVHAAVVLDLVGHAVPVPGAGSLVAMTGAESDPRLPALIAALDPPGVALLPLRNDYVGDMSDHHVFRLEQRPYLFFSCGQWAHYHQSTDTPDRLDYPKMAAIVRLLLDLLHTLDRTPLEGPFETTDTTALELTAARRHFGPIAAAAGLTLDSRDDLDQLVSVIRSQFPV